MSGTNKEAVAKSFQFSNEIRVWSEVLGSRRETELLHVAEIEYVFALLALTQGHYRHAFKNLRLVLELSLQAIYLSMNEVLLREWLGNSADTIWRLIVCEKEGIFSPRVAKVFFPKLISHVNYYRELAKLVYRECSECVHGNIPKHVPLQRSLLFDQTVFDLWHTKAEVVAIVTNFALSLRYIEEMSPDNLLKLELFLSDRIGFIEEIRMLLGGPVKG